MKNKFFECDRNRESNFYMKFCLYSGYGREDSSKCRLVISLFGWYLTIFLPQIIRPYRHWVDMTKYDWHKGESKGYWEEDQRAFGFYLFENHLNLMFGRQADSSSDTMSWGCFLPWNEWNFVRFSLYGLQGEHFWTQMEQEVRKVKGFDRYEKQREMEAQCPSKAFLFKDYDGEEITVVTHIEEREWHRGVKWFRWLKYFFKPQISRSLDLEFKKEVGRRKGSWKGGTLGHSIQMLPGELHEAAFRRYCEKNNMTFLQEAV
jgi:hypothetical protein